MAKFSSTVLSLCVLLLIAITATSSAPSSASVKSNSTLASPTPFEQLDPKCLIPSESNCDFYYNCLEKRIPCGPEGYNLGFGGKFCDAYLKKQLSKKWSNGSLMWMNYVRKCLQKELIPVIQSPNSTTCPKVKDYAFKTHIDCWTKVPKPIPSFCELPINEVLDIVTTVDLRTMFTRHALTTGLGVLGACWNGLLKDIILGKGV